VVAPVLALIAFAPWRRGATRAALALVVVPLLLGLPRWPWWAAAADLPGLGLSRFRMMDARTVAVLGLVVLAAAGLAVVLERHPVGRRPRAWVVALPVGALALAAVTPYAWAQWVVPWTVLAASAVAVAWALHPGAARPWAAVAIVLLAAVSGTHWAAEG